MATAQEIAAKGGKYKTRTVNGQVVNLTDAEVAACVDDEIADDARKVEKAKVQYQADRLEAYPSLGDFADAYYWAQKGDNSKMTAWVAACDKVKSDNPKPD
tara:strand:+ start:96 stop:398 length:303 start_codon:yes stop_codon:yes gene_type:complete